MDIDLEDKVVVGEFQIPRRLVYLTGCSFETFESYGRAQFAKFCAELEIAQNHTLFEIGCGVGRLAIPATRFLSPIGRYTGMDIIKDSIDWCRENISRRYPNFSFCSENVQSQIHNPAGAKQVAEVAFDIPSQSVDRIFLSSVFTHMFPADVTHYLREMRRVLKPGGRILTTMFLLNAPTLASIKAGTAAFNFLYAYREAGCRIQNPEAPEGAVAYYEDFYLSMLESCGFRLYKPIAYGQWSGLGLSQADGQDYVIFHTL